MKFERKSKRTHRAAMFAVVAATAAVGVLLFGCADKPMPPMTAAAVSSTRASPAEGARPTVPTPQTVPNTATAAAIGISDEIRRACGLDVHEAHFAFDSANVRLVDGGILTKVARCFISGPLAGRRLKLVGHADPRGDNDYNLALGQRRADGVKSYLGSEGLAAAHCESTSRGAMDAVGRDEETWAKDRRVDVLLAL